MRVFSPVLTLISPVLIALLAILPGMPAMAQGPVGLSGGLGAGIRSIVEEQGRALVRTDSAQPRLQSEVIVEIGAGKSVTAGAGEAARPSLCPPPTEAFVCGVLVPPPLPELPEQPELQQPETQATEVEHNEVSPADAVPSDAVPNVIDREAADKSDSIESVTVPVTVPVTEPVTELPIVPASVPTSESALVPSEITPVSPTEPLIP